MHIGLADDDGAGIQQFLQRWRIPGRPRILQRRRAPDVGMSAVLMLSLTTIGRPARAPVVSPLSTRPAAASAPSLFRTMNALSPWLARAFERGPHGADGRHLLAADVSDDLGGGGWMGVGHG